MQRLEKIWMEAVDEGSDARYSFTLQDVSDDEAIAAFGVKNLEEMEELFKKLDKNGDGEVNGEEACRYYIHDSDFMCQKFAPENHQHWIYWIENLMRKWDRQ